MSFLTNAIRERRYDRTITSQLMNKQTTMFFDEIQQVEDEIDVNIDKILLRYDSDINTLNWTTSGSSSYLSFQVSYNSTITNVGSTIKTFALPVLQSNTFYTFQVIGNTSFGSQIKSNTISITTAPLHPSNFTISSQNITTSSFELVYNKTNGDATNFSFQPSIATNSLTTNTNYSVYATMTYEINGTPYILLSNTITVLTLSIPPVIHSFTSPSKDHDEITLNFQTSFNDADDTNRVLEIYKDGVLLSSNNQTATGYIVSGLLQNTTYNLQLKIQWYFNGVSQTSIDSSVLTITTDSLNPTNPYFDVQSKTATTITIHNIDYGSDDGATRLSNNIYLDDVLQTSVIQTSYSFSGLNEGQTYNIKITKTISGIANLYEFERNITTFVNALPATDNGSTTTLLSSAPTNRLQWTINTWGDQTPTSIQIIDATTSSTIATLSTTETIYNHTTLLENTTYSYKIRKVYSAGYNESSVINLRTYHFAETDTINSFVRGFDDMTVNINQTPNHDATGVSVQIEYKKSTESTYLSHNILYGNTLSGLQQNTSYDFRIVKTTRIETTDFVNTSPVLSQSTANRPEKATISLNTATSSSLTFNVSQGAMNDGSLTFVKFQLKNASNTWDTIETLTASTTTVSLNTLTSATKYDVRLRKKYSYNGTSYILLSYSGGTTLYNPVLAVSEINFTNVSTNSMTVSWTRNSDSSDSSVIYSVQYYPTTNVSAQQFVESLNKSSLDVSGLIHNTEYTFIVHKFSFINNTQTTETVNTLNVSGQTILPSPPILTLGEIRSTEIDLSFTEEYNGTSTGISFNIVYLDATNTEFVSGTITSPTTLTGLSSQQTYRIRIRKNTSLGYVFSATETATTPLPSQVLPLKPSITFITNHANKSVVDYEPNSNGDSSTAILEFYYIKQLTSTTWGAWTQYSTTRNIISDITAGTFEFDGLESDTTYGLKIKKVSDLIELETVFSIRTLTDGGGGGGGGGGIPWVFPPPPQDGGDDPDDDTDSPDVETNYLLKYDFESGSLTTTNGLSQLTSTHSPYFYLNDPDTSRIYSFNTNQVFQSTIDAVSFGVIDLSTELTMTFKVVVSSLSDFWRVKISNLEIICDGDEITLRVGGLLSYQDYDFPHTKSSPLFNEYVFTMDESSVNYYQNGTINASLPQQNLSLFYSDTTIEFQNTNTNTFSVFEEIYVWFGIQQTAQQIYQEWNDRYYPVGQNYGMIHSRNVDSILNTNIYNTTQQITFTESPTGHFEKFTMNGVDVINNGTGVATQNYVFDSKGAIQAATSTNTQEPITALTNQDFTLTVHIDSLLYTKPVITQNITDITTTDHLVNTATYPFIYGEYYCNQLNQFVVDFYMNTAYNGVYKVIEEYSANVFIDTVDTSVYSTLLTNNYGYRVKLPTTITQVLSGNAYVSNLIQNGLIGSLKSNGQNIITSSAKTLIVGQLPHTSHTTTYNATTKVYTTQIILNNLTGTEQSCIIEIWTNDLEIDNVSYSTSVLTTSQTYETGFTGRRLTITGSAINQNVMSFNYTKLYPNQLFSDHPFRTILYELGGTTFTNRIFSYKEIQASFKEYTFYYNTTVVDGQYVELDLRLEKSNEPLTNVSIDINLQTDSDNKRIFTSVSSGITYSNTLNTINISSFTPFGNDQTDISLCVFRVQGNSSLSYGNLVGIVPSHITTIINNYQETLSNFTYIQNNPVFTYRMISSMECSIGAPVGDNFSATLKLKKIFSKFEKIKFKTIFDTRFLNFRNIEYIDDLSYPITETESVSGNLKTIEFELNDSSKSLSTTFFIRDVFNVYFESSNSLVNFDTDTHLSFEFMELILTNPSTELIETVISQSPNRTYNPTYLLYVNPSVQLNSNAKTTVDLVLNLPVSNHDEINYVDVSLTITDTNKVVDITPSAISTVGNKRTYRQMINQTTTNLTNFFTFRLEQFDRTVGFDEGDIAIEMEDIVYTNIAISNATFNTNTFTFLVEDNVWMNASIDNTLKSIDVSLNGAWTTNLLLIVVFNSLHHNIPGSLLYGADTYGWGIDHTRYYAKTLTGLNDTFFFDTANVDIELDTLYHAKLDDDIKVFITHPNKISQDTVYNNTNKFKSHFKLFTQNPIIGIQNIYTMDLMISKEPDAQIQYMEIEPVFDSNRILVLNIIEKNQPTITSKVSGNLVYDNTSLSYELTNPVQNLYKLGKWRFQLLKPTSSASDIQIGFNILSSSFVLNKPPQYSGISSYFNKTLTSIDETLSYTPRINLRLNIYESGIYIMLELYADIGYSGISAFDIRVQMLGSFTYSTQSTNSLIVNTTRISNIEVLYEYSDPSPSTTTDRGEILLATIWVSSSQSQVVDDDFNHIVPTSVLGYFFTYSKNDFSN